MAIESGVAKPKHTLNHARELANWRQHAATYLQELAAIFPDARSQFEIGSGHYGRLVETAKSLQDLCEPFVKENAFSKDTGSKAATHVTTMMLIEKDAIQAIMAAIEIMGKSN